MSLANDLLRSMTVEEEDKTLVIDHYTRSIIIPKSITTLGVENDDEVLRLDFRMPRYLGMVDLSKFGIRVNYINANGDDGFYKVTDSRVVGDNILFSWLVGPTATAYKGTTSFNVKMVTTDSQSNVLNEYNTAIAKLPVLEGMTVGTDVITRYIDILEQWESRLFGISGTEEAKLIAVSEEEQKNISQHAGVVMASIPADYTTTSKLADKAERTKADAIIRSAEGETVKMEDSSDDYLRGLKIFGKTEQVKTNGHQLYDASWFDTKTGGGATITNNGDGSFTVSGSGTMTASLSLAHTYTHEETVKLLTAGNIYINAEVCTYPYAYAYVGGNSGYTEISNIRDNMNKSTITQEMLDDESTILRIGFYSQTGGTIKPGTFKPVLYQNGDGTFEPYSGGVASPSPEWPQELVCIENPTAIIYGRNLVDIHQLELASNKSITISEDGYTITLVGGSDKTYAYSHYDIPTEVVYALRGRKIRLTSDFVSKSIENAYSPVQLNVKCEDNTFHYPVNHSTKLYHEFTVPDNAVEIRFGIYTNNSNTLLESDNTVVAKGVRLTLADDTEYEPYKPIEIMGVNRTLSGIPVTSGGNYTDTNGQQWVGDVIDFERGVYVQHFKTVAFTGQENWVQDTNYSCAYRVGAGHISIGGLCTHYPTYFTTEDIGTVPGVYMAYTVNHIITDTRFVNDLNGFTAFLAEEYAAGHPVTVLRRLNEPVEIPLTASEIAEFKKLHSNYPTTTVLNDAGATMRVSYNADTKTWIENLIESKIAAYLEGADF